MSLLEKFKSEAATLKNGQLIKLPDFTLYQAISAFELGNPKMDTGLNWIPFSKSLEIRLPETFQCCLEAMDALFCREMAWLQGSTLVQTVFSGIFVEKELQTIKDPLTITSEYLDSLKPIIDRPTTLLSVYVLATLKAISLVIEQVLADRTETISVEEEFHLNTGGWPLLESASFDSVVKLVDCARQYCKSHDQAEIAQRLEMRSEWLFVLRQGITKKHSHIQKLLDMTTDLHSTPDCDHLFTTAVQARSDGVCLARPLVTLQFEAALKFQRSCLEAIVRSSKLLAVQKSAGVLGFFLNFGKVGYTPLIRILVKGLFKQFDLLGVSASAWVERDFTELTFPKYPQVKAKMQKQCKQAYSMFMAQAPLCYFDLITLMCLNRCRQRQALSESIAAWDSLHVAAQTLDKAAAEAGITVESGREFSTWVYQRKLQMMLWATLMGMELELFLPYERSSMYWYSGRLAAMLVDQLKRLKTSYEQQNMRSSESYHYINAIDVEARCMEHLCVANMLIFWVLEKRELIKRPQTEYTTPELTFGLRLECFEAIGVPPVPPFSMYEQEISRYPEELALKTAKANLQSAQAFLKTISDSAGESNELTLLKKSVFGLTATLLKLQKGEAGKLTISTEYHPYFGVPTIA